MWCGVLVEYARTSTKEQEAGFEAQKAELLKHGCEKIFEEQVSSFAARLELDRAIEFVRDGDTLMVTKLDRLARSLTHLQAIMAELNSVFSREIVKSAFTIIVGDFFGSQSRKAE